MLTNICTSTEVIRSFETFMLKQFTYTIDELRVLPMYHKACLLIIDDVDYWADKSLWALYDEASL
jgi:hypothetical protein